MTNTYYDFVAFHKRSALKHQHFLNESLLNSSRTFNLLPETPVPGILELVVDGFVVDAEVAVVDRLVARFEFEPHGLGRGSLFSVLAGAESKDRSIMTMHV